MNWNYTFCFFVTNFLIVFKDIQNESFSISANTGVAFTCKTAPTVAKYVNDGTITSSPGPISRAISERNQSICSRIQCRAIINF